MIKRIALILSTFFLGLLVLFVSLSKVACVNYSFTGPVQASVPKATPGSTEAEKVEIDYFLVYPGGILPDHPLWPIKALRDKIWLTLTLNSSRKAELNLLFADKRLLSAKTLFERKKPELAFATLTKAEKYLETAAQMTEKTRSQGENTGEFDLRLAKAALKHRQTLEEILILAPEDAKPAIIRTFDYSRKVYAQSRDALMSRGLSVPENPFNGN